MQDNLIISLHNPLQHIAISLEIKVNILIFHFISRLQRRCKVIQVYVNTIMQTELNMQTICLPGNF